MKRFKRQLEVMQFHARVARPESPELNPLLDTFLKRKDNSFWYFIYCFKVEINVTIKNIYMP